MCNAGFGLRQAFERPALLMLGAAGCIHARRQKTFLLNLHHLIDTQGRGVHGPDERGLERLFTHNVKLYNLAYRQAGCAVACAELTQTSIRSRKPPDQRLHGHVCVII